MRITIPVSGDGDAWMSHLPEINFDPEHLIDDSGRISIPKVIALFKEANDFHVAKFSRQMFMIGTDDRYNTLSMAVEFLRQLAAVTHWLENRPGAKAHVSSDGSKQDNRLERRMTRDQVAFCRIDIREVRSGVKFVVGYANPNEHIIGNCLGGAREFAIYVTRILLHLAEEVNRKSVELNAGLIVIVEGSDPDLVSDARAREESGRKIDGIREANERRATCPNNRAGFCAPIMPACRCFYRGRCVEAKIDDALDRGIIKTKEGGAK